MVPSDGLAYVDRQPSGCHERRGGLTFRAEWGGEWRRFLACSSALCARVWWPQQRRHAHTAGIVWGLRRAVGSLNITAVVILLGGILYAMGSFLPWVTASSAFGSASKSGMEGGDGLLTVFFGVVLALLGLTRVQRPGLPGNRLTMVILGALAVGVAVFEGSNIQSKLEDISSAYVVASVGVGIYVMGVGGALVILASLFGEPKSSRAGAAAAPPV